MMNLYTGLADRERENHAIASKARQLTVYERHCKVRCIIRTQADDDLTRVEDGHSAETESVRMQVMAARIIWMPRSYRRRRDGVAPISRVKGVQ